MSMPGMLALAYAETQRAARAFANLPQDESKDCNCQCHTTFLPRSERRLVPRAVAQKLCQSCYDEFYADWPTLIDELIGA